MAARLGTQGGEPGQAGPWFRLVCAQQGAGPAVGYEIGREGTKGAGPGVVDKRPRPSLGLSGRALRLVKAVAMLMQARVQQLARPAAIEQGGDQQV